ncbi:MAG: Hsp70 family protein [Pseudomonadota bacterium]
MQDCIYGIDLGTTFTKCAVIDPGTSFVRPIEVDHGSLSIQSIVGLGVEGQGTVAYVGSSCAGRMEFPDRSLDQFRVVEEAKRWMGVLEADVVGAPPWPFNEWQYIPQDIAALVLRRVKMAVDERMPGYPLRRAVITHPQKFTQNERLATRQAGEIAGIQVVTSIAEPDAAALCYGADNEPGLYMIFDCGGGTLDITIAKIAGRDSPIDVVTSEGLYKAGRDIDRRILDMMCEQYQASFPDFERTAHLDRTTEAVWLDRARTMKEKLGSRSRDGIEIKEQAAEICVRNDAYEGGPCRVRIASMEVEHRVKDIIDDFRDCAYKALDYAHISPAGLKAVLLVGGTSRMAAVRRMIETEPPSGLGARVNAQLDSTTAIASGAAKLAARWKAEAGPAKADDGREAESSREPASRAPQLVLDTIRSALAYGIGIPILKNDNPCLHVMIPKDTPLPCVKEQVFRTANAGDTSIRVDMYFDMFEKDLDEMPEKALLGHCVLAGIPPGQPAGRPVEVRINVAHNEEMRLEVTDCRTGLRTESAVHHNEKAVVRPDDIAARRAHISSIRIM